MRGGVFVKGHWVVRKKRLPAFLLPSPVGRCGPQRRLFEESFTAKVPRSPRNMEKMGMWIEEGHLHRGWDLQSQSFSWVPPSGLRTAKASPFEQNALNRCLIGAHSEYRTFFRNPITPHENSIFSPPLGEICGSCLCGRDPRNLGSSKRAGGHRQRQCVQHQLSKRLDKWLEWRHRLWAMDDQLGSWDRICRGLDWQPRVCGHHRNLNKLFRALRESEWFRCYGDRITVL